MVKLDSMADDLFGPDPFSAEVVASLTTQSDPTDGELKAEKSEVDIEPDLDLETEPVPSPALEPEPLRHPAGNEVTSPLSFAETTFPATIRILGRDLDGNFACVSFGQAFRTLPNIETLDLSSRMLDDPKTRITPIVGYFDRRGEVVILNLSEVIANAQSMPIHPQDQFWVFIVRDRAAIQALKIGLELHYLAIHGREADDARAFLRLCLVSGRCADTTRLDEARIFRGWCGPTAKPYAIREMMTRFGFADKRYSKLRELLRKEGLTQQPSGNSQGSSDEADGPKLEIQQKRLKRFLAAQHFRAANYFWADAVPHANTAMKDANQSLPTDWAIMCALLASCKTRIKDPSKQLQALLDPTQSSLDTLRTFISQLRKEHDLPLFASTTHLQAKALLKSVTECDNG